MYSIEVGNFDDPLDLHSFKLKEIIFIKHIIIIINVFFFVTFFFCELT
jgi:hypothetical protein